jgi:chemotaxis protein CheC
LLEISNLLVGAVLNGGSETLSMNLGFSAPSLMAISKSLDQVLRKENLTWSHALLLEVNFTLENRDFKSHLLLFMTEDTIDKLGGVLDEFLQDY